MRSFGIFVQSDHRRGGPGSGVAAGSGLFRFSARQNPWLPIGSSQRKPRREQGHCGKRFDAEICRTCPALSHRSGREVTEPLYKAGQKRLPPGGHVLGEAETNGVSSRGGKGLGVYSARDRLRARTGVRSSSWQSELVAKQLAICTEISAPGNTNKSSLSGQRALVVSINGYVPVHKAYSTQRAGCRPYGMEDSVLTT